MGLEGNYEIFYLHESGGSFGSGYLEGVKMAKMNMGIINTVKRAISEDRKSVV